MFTGFMRLDQIFEYRSSLLGHTFPDHAQRRHPKTVSFFTTETEALFPQGQNDRALPVAKNK